MARPQHLAGRLLRSLGRRNRSNGVQIDLIVTNADRAEVAVAPCERPLVSILIVSYHSAHVLMRCVERIVATTDPAATPYEVLVVDNVDDERGERQPSDAVRLLVERTRGVRLLACPVNTGFGGGNNLAARAARGRLLCLCNPDVELPTAWAQPLIDALEQPGVGIAAPALVNRDGSIQELGQVLLDSGFTLPVGGPDLFPGDWQQAVSRAVDYASAALWLVRRTDFLDLGGFDPTYHPAYWEDVDFALRLEARELCTQLVPEVHVVHDRGGSSEASLALAQRSHARFVERWSKRLALQPAHPRTPAQQVAARDRASLATSARRSHPHV